MASRPGEGPRSNEIGGGGVTSLTPGLRERTTRATRTRTSNGEDDEDENGEEADDEDDDEDGEDEDDEDDGDEDADERRRAARARPNESPFAGCGSGAATASAARHAHTRSRPTSQRPVADFTSDRVPARKRVAFCFEPRDGRGRCTSPIARRKASTERETNCKMPPQVDPGSTAHQAQIHPT